MKLIGLIMILFSVLACQVYNSASRDKLLYGNNIDANSEFGKAFTVISNRCISCHSNFGSLTTDADWVSSGYVTAGSLTSSKVYNRLLGAELGVAEENMPQDSVLTSGELAAIRTWIINM